MLKEYDMDVNFFQMLSRKCDGGTVTFGDDSKGKIIGIGNVKFGNSPLIEIIGVTVTFGNSPLIENN